MRSAVRPLLVLWRARRPTSRLVLRPLCAAAQPRRAFSSSSSADAAQGISTDLLVSLSMNYNNSAESHEGLIANLSK